MITRYLTIGDCALLALLFALAVSLIFVLPASVISGGTEVIVRSGDRVVARYSLEEDRVFDVSGPLGDTVVEIEAGRAGIRSSPCPHKTCVRMGKIGREGGVVVCIPNKITVSVGNEQRDGLDAVSR
jgi:hypothetical protein